MKSQILIILLAFFIGMTSCKKDELDSVSNGINFYNDEQLSDIMVKYDEIVGYDSTQYVFVLKEMACNRIAEKVKPDSHVTLFIALDNNLIYKASCIPLYYSMLYTDIVTFKVEMPNKVFIQLGYPPGIPKRFFTGIDKRNDQRLIERLKEDNKLIEIED
jgi:hypothetical protein